MIWNTQLSHISAPVGDAEGLVDGQAEGLAVGDVDGIALGDAVGIAVRWST